MRKGYLIFRERFGEWTKDMFEADSPNKKVRGFDTLAYPTISGIGDTFVSALGVYEGVFELSGVIRAFIAKTSVGGRVMCRENCRSISHNMSDYDAVSLYPTSICKGPGFLLGEPEIWTPEIDLSECDGYFLRVLVTKVGRDLPFPTLCLKTEDGGNDWTNDLVGQYVYANRFMLEDFAEFQQGEFEIKQGYVYRKGRTTKVRDVVRKVFDERLRYKREGNPLQLCLKLLLNSLYGQTGLKQIDTEVMGC